MQETEKPTKIAQTPTKSHETELEELGFMAAAVTVKTSREMAHKMRIAFEHFRVVSSENMDRFQKELYKRTHKFNPLRYEEYYQRAIFTPIGQYKQVPPREALEKVRAAKALGCFDSFEVMTIETVEQQRIPDPIIFGRITGCSNRYYICQWDDDVKIEQILREDEG
jgi:hypothetical protein